ncbi:type III secretion system effector XopT [Xanthomonas oryzae]|uniref:type III secretion system effector XopT n=1 Tax=Xanthomonas oryzae TaxID=347 RepID=UPI0018EFFB95|nr:type III secretion system effector XopT [Xanthomonas oryzae]WDN44956.1 hypothetical protein LL923_01265 [Xanthomonas oryzae]WFC23142.1 type III secretion system effector XopT [Xanthomonas oryzae pv. oryzae]
MRPLSPNSAIIANDLVDNGLAGSDSPDQAIADTVNWRRTQHGQDALAQLAEMAPAPWRRRVLPADPTPYRIQEIQQHRLNRTSMSMQSVPPALSLSGELAFDPMQFLDIPDTPSSAPSAPALQEVANRSELSVPLGESVDSAAIAPPTPPSSYSHGVGHYPAPSASLLASSSTHATVMPVPASTGKGPIVAGLPSQAPGSSTPGPIPKSTRSSLEKVLDPATGKFVSKRALALREQVVDPVTGELVSKGALSNRKRVLDPLTGQLVSRNTLSKRQMVTDPETGEAVSRATLANRKRVLDPATGEVVSKATLAMRKKVTDPATGEVVSKAALAMRKRRRLDRHGN